MYLYIAQTKFNFGGVRACACMCMCTGLCACRELRRIPSVFFYSCPSYFLETRSLTEPEVYLGWLSSALLGCTFSVPQHWGYMHGQPHLICTWVLKI